MPKDVRAEPDRRQVLKGLGALGGVALLGGSAVLAWRGWADDAPDSAMPAVGQSTLDELAGAVTSGGPGKDGIPPIDDPKFVAAGQADFLGDDDVVFGLTYRGQTRAYPQLVLVWHEVVNDVVGGEPLTVTYCPLTGTTIGFSGPADQKLTFGTTGNLVNSNLLMYDRQTESEWPQILGTAISGDRKGQRLDTVALVWTTWGAWRARHPDTAVLSTDTGAIRNYGSDPYGSYTPLRGYYAEEELYFSVRHSDDRFDAKHVVLGVRADRSQLAIDKELVRREKVVETDVADTPVVARWDSELDTAVVVRADSGEPADFLDAMWFSWYAFYPGTRVMR